MARFPNRFRCLITDPFMEALQPLAFSVITNCLQLASTENARFGLIPFRSPLLWESLLISLPLGTEMFHFPRFASSGLCVQPEMTGHNSGRVSPFGNPRIKACLAAPRGISQPTTSFIAYQRQGIHRLPLLSCLDYFSHSLCIFQRTIRAFLRPGKKPSSQKTASCQIVNAIPAPHHILVEVNGFEPMTSCVQGRRSPS